MAGLLSACGAAPPSVPQSPAEPDVLTLLPSGATSIIVARPRALFEAPASRRVIARLFPDERVELLRAQHGIDPRTVELLVVASYEEGEVILVVGPFLARVAVAEIGHRMVPVESHAEVPRPRVGGVFRGTRLDAIAVGGHTLALVAGPPSLAGRLLSTLDGTARAFDGAAFLQREPAPPFLWVRPIPLDLPLDAPLAILLARERSLVLTASPTDDATVRLRIELEGEFPPGAERNFRRLAESLAQTDLGRAIGAPSALADLTIEPEAGGLSLETSLAAEALATGLWLAMGAEIEEALSSVSDSAQTD